MRRGLGLPNKHGRYCSVIQRRLQAKRQQGGLQPHTIAVAKFFSACGELNTMFAIQRKYELYKNHKSLLNLFSFTSILLQMLHVADQFFIHNNFF
jgi:hypothetical protein